uniref:Uncharacterized protein n=1 Tax=Plectus sambesii TaxID=2011161 RepID=A0A914URE5_9BILA
ESVEASTFTKWRPGYRSSSSVNNCLVLRHNADDSIEKDYYYWDAVTCDSTLPFICQTPPKDIGCVHGNGGDYAGSANVTKLGYPCHAWDDAAMLKAGVLFPRQTDWHHNFCRNPDGDRRPWCMVSPTQYDLCDIPACDQQQDDADCDPDEIRCGDSQECVSTAFICDYESDCANGFDERNCTNWIDNFIKTPSKKLTGAVSEIWTYIPHPQGCARRCVENQSFRCRAFSYMTEQKTCLLSKHDRKLGASLITATDADFYELKDSPSTTAAPSGCNRNEFRCTNNRCISSALVCDSIDNCGDRSDERNCTNFSIRIVGGGAAEGRLEVRAFNRWGRVCADDFDLSAAEVACKQLGFTYVANFIAF